MKTGSWGEDFYSRSGNQKFRAGYVESGETIRPPSGDNKSSFGFTHWEFRGNFRAGDTIVGGISV